MVNVLFQTNLQHNFFFVFKFQWTNVPCRTDVRWTDMYEPVTPGCSGFLCLIPDFVKTYRRHKDIGGKGQNILWKKREILVLVLTTSRRNSFVCSWGICTSLWWLTIIMIGITLCYRCVLDVCHVLGFKVMRRLFSCPVLGVGLSKRGRGVMQ